jgi:hypothetical protein
MVIALIFFVITGLTKNSQIALIISSIILLFLLLLVFWGLNTKVEINEKGLYYYSVLNRKCIEWRKVKSYGVYKVSRNDFDILKKESYDKLSIWGQKFIYVSEYQDYFSNSFRKTRTGYIDFNYRREAFLEIERLIKAVNQ